MTVSQLAIYMLIGLIGLLFIVGWIGVWFLKGWLFWSLLATLIAATVTVSPFVIWFLFGNVQ